MIPLSGRNTPATFRAVPCETVNLFGLLMNEPQGFPSVTSLLSHVDNEALYYSHFHMFTMAAAQILCGYFLMLFFVYNQGKGFLELGNIFINDIALSFIIFAALLGCICIIRKVFLFPNSLAVFGRLKFTEA